MTPEPRRVAVGDESVTALRYAASAPAGLMLILGHGAGAGQSSAFMVSFAAGLAARGIDTVTFDFLYKEQGRGLPDPNHRLEACWRAVIDAMRGEGALAIGGKSMGGRIATQVAAGGAGPLAGLVLLGYPLHPGRPDRLRAAHLAKITVPMLFVQGAKDRFGTPEELRPILATLRAPAELHVVAEGDHSFKAPKRSGFTAKDIHEAVQDRIAAWLRQMVPRGGEKP